MNETVAFALALGVIFLTHFQSCITGFGATVLAMPFVAMLIGIETAVPVLLVQGGLLSLLVVIESWRKIVWREFLIVIVLMGLGIAPGIWMFANLRKDILMLILAGFAVVVGVEGLIRYGLAPAAAANAAPKQATPRARMLSAFLLPLAGAIHGAFGTGGPLLVIYATRAIPDKSLFRVTLCLVWTTLNTVLVAQKAGSGAMPGRVLLLTLIAIPVSVFGFWAGNRVHHRVNDLAFRRIVFGVLTAVGLFMGWSALGPSKGPAPQAPAGQERIEPTEDVR